LLGAEKCRRNACASEVMHCVSRSAETHECGSLFALFLLASMRMGAQMDPSDNRSLFELVCDEELRIGQLRCVDDAHVVVDN
jgi:hypothetical protein